MTTHIPLPPIDTQPKNICCEYCPVACGYKAYTWPEGTEGGPRAHQNALGLSFPITEPESGGITANMYQQVEVDGVPHHLLVIPDRAMKSVNRRGGHSVRGGALAKKFYNKDGKTKDRLLEPLLRINGELQPISWDLATDIVAQLSTYVIDKWGPLAWGMKRYSYGGHENVTAITKLAFQAIGSPNHAPHHAPAVGDDVPGLSDTGIDAFGACFEDDANADVILIAGTDPYETKTVRFLEWMAPSGAPIITVDPRRTFISNYAESKGGLHLQLKIGTDTALFGAIARYIIEQNWQDAAFIREFTASSAEIAAESKWRRRQFGQSFEEYRDYLLLEDAFSLVGAEQVTGVPQAKIVQAAEMLSGRGTTPKVTMLFEKGLYWSHNYENTAAFGSLGVLLGAVGREGRATARLGGHQRGGQGAGGYPLDLSPHEFEGHKIEMDADRWMVEGKTRLSWAIGVNWIGAAACSAAIEGALKSLVQQTGPVVASESTAIDQLKAKMDAGGMVFVHQEIYANDTTKYADLVLPAAAWGERDFARHNAERRLRLYDKVVEPPGQAREDWKIVAEVAQKMGYEGFDWADGSALLEEAAGYSQGSRRDFSELPAAAQAQGKSIYDLLREMGNEGIQTPARTIDGKLTPTRRLHADLRFKTTSTKANFVRADWQAVAARNAALAPRDDELWVTNSRVNHLWNNMSDFTRRAYAIRRWPANFLEIHPDDAAARGIANGDLLRIENDDVADQVGGTIAASFEAVAYVSDIVPAGLTNTYVCYPGSYGNSVTSGDATLQPLTARYVFKLGRGRIVRVGRWQGPSFPLAPRNLAPKEVL